VPAVELAPEVGTPLGTVIVTGGARGLGAAVVAAVVEAGGTPIVLDMRTPSAEAQHVVVDLADTRAAERAVGEIAARQPMHGCVACAGIDVPGPLTAIPGDVWERIVTVNLFGTAAVIRAALPSLEQARGRIVTVASTLGHRAVSDGSAYCASKFGVVGLTRALAAELRGRVGVTLLSPGGMDTNFFDDRAEQYRPADDVRLADPRQIADSVVFALSRPPGVEIRELVVTGPNEESWP
jgi:NAD(P)-dependent dehydrogenase (short-subunit alcohol dehydrogenase family)